MIDLTVMHLLLLPIFVFFELVLGSFALQTDKAVIQVDSLQAGDVLQGVVSIQGTVKAEQFSHYEVSFAYASDTTGTWFLIAQGSQPVENGLLASWDTSLITDGDYRLRVLIRLLDGSSEELLLPNIRVRNYTVVETKVIPAELTVLTASPATETPTATQTVETAANMPFAGNPGSISEADFGKMLAVGASISVLLFILFGLYQAASQHSRRR